MMDAIFFDLGMVLVTFDWNIAIPRFAARNGGNTERVKEFLAHSFHDAFERNELSAHDFFERGRATMEFEGTQTEFQTYWNEIFSEIPSSVEMVRALASSLPLYTLSNTNPWHAAYLEQHFDWMNLFTRRFYSWTLGVRKPDARIYEKALARANVPPQRALLIDDRIENINGAHAVGMKTLHAPTPQVLQDKLPEFFPQLLILQSTMETHK